MEAQCDPDGSRWSQNGFEGLPGGAPNVCQSKIHMYLAFQHTGGAIGGFFQHHFGANGTQNGREGAVMDVVWSSANEGSLKAAPHRQASLYKVLCVGATTTLAILLGQPAG